MNIIEQWKPIDGFEGLYEISNLGRIKSLNYIHTGKERVLKPDKNNKGYLRVSLCRNGKVKRFLVHRLVASAFIPNPEGLPEINHKDENPLNNAISNIEWCSAKYNVNFGTRNKRSAISQSMAVEASKYPDFRTIELRFASTQEANRNGYNSGAVSTCCRRCFNYEGNNKYRGLYWRYAV